MRFGEIKPDDQQASLAIHRARDLVVRQRTQVVNVIRSILRKFGHILPTGIDAVSKFTREHGTQEQLELPESAEEMKWVTLRPGGVLDTLLEMNAAYLKKGEQTMPADLEVPATAVLTRDVARCLAMAPRVPGVEGERIDLGMNKPTNIIQIAEMLSKELGRPIKAERSPKFITSVMFGIMGLLKASMKDNVKAREYVSGGNDIADVTRQSEVFGPPSTMAVSIKRWVAKMEAYLPPRNTRFEEPYFCIHQLWLIRTSGA